jgi:two-component system, chemotaxis family, sensor kinase Cph1
VLWFRPELVRTVRWAGRPDKDVLQEPAAGEGQQDGGVRLHPRRSFEAWSETVRGRSAPWHDADLRAADQLRARVRDIVIANAATIARLNERLQLSNDELDSFAWIVGHDLKEPLRGMVNSAHAIADGEMEHVETVIRLGSRMHVMLDSLLDHARADKLELKREHVALAEVVAEVVDSLRARIEENDVVIDVVQPLPTVYADRVRLASVLQNLIANAIKYNDSAVKRVEIGGGRDGDTVAVYVRDNGIGIEPRHHDSIFELFRRLHPRDSYGGGAGAGLTITRRMVERHGGRIRVESEPGTGTTFHFTLEGAAAPGDG